MAKRIVVNIEKCVGCGSCEFYCAVAHSSSKDPVKILLKGENPGYRINVESYGQRPVPVTCRQCDEPACMMACPTGALHRHGKNFPVLVDDERCIGCTMCVQACPFGVMTTKPSGEGVMKCDLCVERQAQGLKPACVTACLTGALVFEEEEESNRDKRKKTAEQMVAAQFEHKTISEE